MPRPYRMRLPGPLGPGRPDAPVPEAAPGDGPESPAPAEAAGEPERETIDWELDEEVRLEQELTRVRVERAAREARSRARNEEAEARKVIADASQETLTADLDAILEDVRSLLPGADQWMAKLKTALDAHDARLATLTPANPAELLSHRSGYVVERHAIAPVLPLIRMLGARSA